MCNTNECEYCQSPDATLRHDPYKYEVHDDGSEHWLCDDCAEQRFMDI